MNRPITRHEEELYEEDVSWAREHVEPEATDAEVLKVAEQRAADREDDPCNICNLRWCDCDGIHDRGKDS